MLHTHTHTYAQKIMAVMNIQPKQGKINYTKNWKEITYVIAGKNLFIPHGKIRVCPK